MSEPIEILLNPKKQLLRLNCGQCGDTKDIMLEIQGDKILVSIQEAYDTTEEECPPELLLTPVELII